jgi:hypothetical protein
MRMLPQRWIGVLISVVGGAILGFTTARRLSVGWSLDLLGWSFVGALGLGVLVFLLSLVQLGGDSRLAQLRARFSESVVVQTYPTDSLAEQLHSLGPWLVRDPATLMVTATLVIDELGVGVWGGSRAPYCVAFVPWASVTAFGTGPTESDKGTLMIETAEGARLVTSLEQTDRYRLGTGEVQQAELAEIVGRVNAMRGVARGGVAASPSLVMTSGLEPGTTAWAARRVSALARPPVVAVVFLCGLIGGALVALGASAPGQLLIAVSFAATAIGFIGLRVERRARRRERAAGYTTLNGLELDLTQRHPRTGGILRAAGQRPLSREVLSQLTGL